MKYATPVLVFTTVSLTVILLGSGQSCRQPQQANSVHYEAQETVIVRGESPGDISITRNSSEKMPETAAAVLPRDVAAPDEDAEGSAVARSGGIREITLGKRLIVTVPSHWIRKASAVPFIEYEFTVPASGEGKSDGRVTFSSAGGGVQANIERWIGQFRLPGGMGESEQVRPKLVEVDGQKVHIVDLAGTYLEPSGPMMAERIEREGYRMLGAIIECDDGFLYFIKFCGPEATVTENESAFQSLIQGLRKVSSK